MKWTWGQPHYDYNSSNISWPQLYPRVFKVGSRCSCFHRIQVNLTSEAGPRSPPRVVCSHPASFHLPFTRISKIGFRPCSKSTCLPYVQRARVTSLAALLLCSWTTAEPSQRGTTPPTWRLTLFLSLCSSTKIQFYQMIPMGGRPRLSPHANALTANLRLSSSPSSVLTLTPCLWCNTRALKLRVCPCVALSR